MPEVTRDVIEVGATVREALPNALYRVELESGRRESVVAHTAPGLLRLLPGDGVVVELKPYDRTHGRILRRR
jgi:translation initiation factor IF-1